MKNEIIISSIKLTHESRLQLNAEVSHGHSSSFSWTLLKKKVRHREHQRRNRWWKVKKCILNRLKQMTVRLT